MEAQDDDNFDPGAEYVAIITENLVDDEDVLRRPEAFYESNRERFQKELEKQAWEDTV